MSRELGHTGEAVAAKYYIRRGYLLLNHNYRTRMGELDLILYKDGGVVFAEVKTRPARFCPPGRGGGLPQAAAADRCGKELFAKQPLRRRPRPL